MQNNIVDLIPSFVMDSFFFPEIHNTFLPLPLSININTSTPSPAVKSFAETVDNVCNIPFSQFPIPCVKGDHLAIGIPEYEYKHGVEAYKHNLHGIVVWSKCCIPLTVVPMRLKLSRLWKSIIKWGITSLGKGFFKFSFSCLEDVHIVRSVNA